MSTLIPNLASVVDTIYFLLGALVIAKLAHSWVGQLDRRSVAAYLALTFVFFSIPLLTPQYQLPLDYLYQFDPWRESVESPPKAIQNPLLTDVALQMIPFRTLVRDRLLRGEAPLWSHELGTGQPLLGNAQSAPFAPLHLLALPLPPLRALTVAAAWQVFVTLLLMHLLALQLGASREGAMLAAIAFGLSVFQIGWLYHPLSMVSVWLPGVLLTLERLRLGLPNAAKGLVFFLSAMIASGNPGIAAICGGVGMIWWLALLVKCSRRSAFFFQSAVASLIAVGLTAPIWLPLTETIPLSERAILLDRSPETVQPPSFEPSLLGTIVSPFALGSPRDGNWSTRSNFLEISTGYCGLLTLCIALFGAVAIRGAALSWTMAGLVALTLALGVPPLYELISPPVWLAGLPLGRLRLVFVLATALGAALSIDRLAETRSSRWIAGLILSAGFVGLQLATPADETLWQTASRLSVSLGLLALLGVLWIERLRPQLVTLAIGVVLVDLALFGMRFHPISRGNYNLDPPAVVRQMSRSESPQKPGRFSALDGRLLPYVGSTYGIWDPRGFDPMRPGAALQLLRKRLDRPAPVGMFLQRAPIDQGFLDFLGIRYLLTGPSDKPGDQWRQVYRDNRVVLWESVTALPIFFVPKNVVACRTQDEARVFGETNRDFEARSCANIASDPSSQDGSIRIVEVIPNGFRLLFDSTTSAIIASSVTWMPGWRLRIDNRNAEDLVTNGAFLGARVEAGSHELRFDYTPWQWRIGWICSFASLGFGLLLISHRSSPRALK